MLLDQIVERDVEIRPPLNAALAAPMAQRDLATVQQILAESGRHEGIACPVLLDRTGRVTAAEPHAAGAAPPPSHEVIARDTLAGVDDLHVRVPLTLAGQPLGVLRFGLSTRSRSPRSCSPSARRTDRSRAGTAGPASGSRSRANAMADDRERCLAAGMDDHRAKPIRPEALRALIERRLGRTTGPAVAGAAAVGRGAACG